MVYWAFHCWNNSIITVIFILTNICLLRFNPTVYLCSNTDVQRMTTPPFISAAILQSRCLKSTYSVSRTLAIVFICTVTWLYVSLEYHARYVMTTARPVAWPREEDAHKGHMTEDHHHIILRSVHFRFKIQQHRKNKVFKCFYIQHYLFLYISCKICAMRRIWLWHSLSTLLNLLLEAWQ